MYFCGAGGCVPWLPKAVMTSVVTAFALPPKGGFETRQCHVSTLGIILFV